MIKYIRRFPATYKRFCGWVYNKYGHTPSYLEFVKPEFTYRLLREFFGVAAIVPSDLTTEELLYSDAKPILEKYEFQITGGKKEDPIQADPFRPAIKTEQDKYIFDKWWDEHKIRIWESIKEEPAPF